MSVIPTEDSGIGRKASNIPRDALSLWFRQRNGSGSECRLLKLDHDSFLSNKLVDIGSSVRYLELPGTGTEFPTAVEWNEGSERSVTPSHDIGVVGTMTSPLYDVELQRRIFNNAGRRIEA